MDGVRISKETLNVLKDGEYFLVFFSHNCWWKQIQFFNILICQESKVSTFKTLPQTNSGEKTTTNEDNNVCRFLKCTSENHQINPKELTLHHDDVCSHTAKYAVEFLEQKSIRIMEHPPWSPDLVMCNFCPFYKLKKVYVLTIFIPKIK